jgi:hypothetical protein
MATSTHSPVSPDPESLTRSFEVDSPAAQPSRHSIRITTLLFFLSGIVWPLFGVPATVYMIRTGARPVIFGIHALSGPWTATYDHEVIVALHVIFLALTALEVPAGYWLWKSAKKGAVLGLALQPLEAIFWYGFFLPFPPLLGVLKVVLLLGGWNSRR